jgi:hypothetical protein
MMIPVNRALISGAAGTGNRHQSGTGDWRINQQ